MNLLGNALWRLIEQSDSVTWMVLLSLLLVSVICWTIAFYKLILQRVKHQQLNEVLTEIRHVNSVEKLVSLINQHAKSYPGHLLVEQMRHVRLLLEDKKEQELAAQDIELLNEQRERIIFDMVQTEETYLPFLMISYLSAPLVGLFGTVWGLIHAFVSISQRQFADIATIAPGIAEALLTTLAGLVVAIPALVMYHYLNGRVQNIEYKLYKVSDKLHVSIQRFFLHGKDIREVSVPNESPSAIPS